METHQQHTVLVVDDDENILKILGNLLSQEGINVISSASPLRALELIGEKIPCLAVLDVMMPEMDGLTLCRRLKQDPRTAHIPVILSSGKIQNADVLAGIDAGAADYIKKPFSPDEVRLRLWTHLRLHEETLQNQKEDFYRILFEGSQDALMTIAPPAWQFTTGNAAAIKMFEACDFSEFIQHKFWEYSPEFQPDGKPSGEKAQEMISIAMQEGAHFFEWVHRRLNGIDFPATVLLTRMKTSGQCLVHATVRDISKELQIREELKIQNIILTTQMEAAIDGILVVDDQGKIISLNQRFIDLWKIPEEIISTKSDQVVIESVLNLLANPEEFLHRVKFLYDHKNETSRDEIILKDDRHFDRYSAPMLGADGKNYGRVWFFRDITPRVLREKLVAEKNTELLLANRELKNAQARLIQQEKLASIGKLAAGVAHELNNPIGFVSSNFLTLKKYLNVLTEYIQLWEDLGGTIQSLSASALLEKTESLKTFKKNKKMDFITQDINGLFSESEDGLNRITTIVQNLRNFSRVDAANKVENYDLNTGIENTLSVARNEIKYVADLELNLQEMPMIQCVGGEINQVLLNVLVNAAQAIKEQNRPGKGLIKISTHAGEKTVYCEIFNNGPEIPPEIIDKIFDPFFTTKEAGRGTGLGLNISYDIIVNKHQGELSVRNLPGQGAVFVIQLPIQSARINDQNEE